MKVGLISDTHDHLGNVEIALDLFEREGVETLIHAGDWVAPFTVRKFDRFHGPLIGAFGNNDGEIIGLSRAFREMGATVRGEMTELELDGMRAAVIHGTYPTLVEALVKSQLFPIIITGHTHQSLVEHRDDVLLVNPGEACGYLHGRSTVGILDTEGPDAIIRDLH
jgi:putative phosphoesterase